MRRSSPSSTDEHDVRRAREAWTVPGAKLLKTTTSKNQQQKNNSSHSTKHAKLGDKLCGAFLPCALKHKPYRGRTRGLAPKGSRKHHLRKERFHARGVLSTYGRLEWKAAAARNNNRNKTTVSIAHSHAHVKPLRPSGHVVVMFARPAAAADTAPVPAVGELSNAMLPPVAAGVTVCFVILFLLLSLLLPPHPRSPVHGKASVPPPCHEVSR